jgi:hypothetical protein
MPTTSVAEAWTSLLLALAIGGIAVVLGVLQWWEHRTRASVMTDLERRYFVLQDIRRAIGIVLLCILAPSIYVGSRLPTRVTDPPHPGATAADPIDGDRIPSASAVHPNRRFLVVWLAVFATVAAVLGLALIDWISTRRYARRQREALIQEKVELLVETRRLAGSRPDRPEDGPPRLPF